MNRVPLLDAKGVGPHVERTNNIIYYASPVSRIHVV